MSPKTVLIAFGSVVLVIAALVVLRGMRPPGPATAVPETLSNTNEVVEVAPVQRTPGAVITNVVASTPEQDKEAARQSADEEMKDALLEGSANPAKVEAVRNYLQSTDAEVRKTAVQTMMHLTDREGIPALKAALEKVQDPREKVAIMDAIEYLETPEDPMVKTLDEAITNTPAPISTGAAK